MASEGMYPAIDPLASTSSLLDPRLVGETHFRIAQDVRKTIAHYRELQEITALLGIEELSSADRTAVKQSRRLMRFLTQPLMVTVGFIGKQGRSVELDATLEGCRTFLDGEADDWAESSLYISGRFGRCPDKGSRGGERGAMRLTIATPLAILVESGDVVHLRAEDETGSFGILAGHADFLTALAVSVVTWRGQRGAGHHAAVRGGMLEVLGGGEIAIATPESVLGDDLHCLEIDVLAGFRRMAADEQAARTGTQRLYVAAIGQIYRLLRPGPAAALPSAPGARRYIGPK
jgi:F-type H+/Na+-transporting ATPase subunit beta